MSAGVPCFIAELAKALGEVSVPAGLIEMQCECCQSLFLDPLDHS